MDVEIRLDRVDRIYRQGDVLTGTVVVHADRGGSHAGIRLVAEGLIKLQLSARSVGLFEAFYSSIRPVSLLYHEQAVASAGKLDLGATEFPFSFPVQPCGSADLHETYHGVYVNTLYTVRIEVVRGALQRNITKEVEFMVEVPPKAMPDGEAVEFRVTPDALRGIHEHVRTKVPPFVISGVLSRTNCAVNVPLTGEILIEESESEISSIELQLVRMETVVYAEGVAREATEIQNIQIADGDVSRNVPIPVHMVFPRLFTCPTTIAGAFKIEFELNVVVAFKSGFLVTENFPLHLFRGEPTVHSL